MWCNVIFLSISAVSCEWRKKVSLNSSRCFFFHSLPVYDLRLNLVVIAIIMICTKIGTKIDSDRNFHVADFCIILYTDALCICHAFLIDFLKNSAYGIHDSNFNDSDDWYVIIVFKIANSEFDTNFLDGVKKRIEFVLLMLM